MERLTIDAAAEYLGMPVASLRWRRAKNLPPRTFKVGKRIFADKSDLDAFIEAEAIRTERGLQ